MNGMSVERCPQLTRAPSTHYNTTIGRPVDGVSTAFAELVRDLIDGKPVQPNEPLDIFVNSANLPVQARLVAWDATDSVTRCFVIDVIVRDCNDGHGAWDVARPAPPNLLDDISNEHDGSWQLYNCRIALQAWSKRSAWAGQWP